MSCPRVDRAIVGPFDVAQVVAWVETLGDRLDGEQYAELLDYRQWFARALNDVTVRETLTVLRVGLEGSEIIDEVRRTTAAGIVRDMEDWLDREYDAG